MSDARGGFREILDSIPWETLACSDGGKSQALRERLIATEAGSADAVDDVQRLIWAGGRIFPVTPYAARSLVGLLDSAEATTAGSVALLLAVLAECHPLDLDAVTTRSAVRAGAPAYLSALRRFATEPHVAMPLVFLLAHLHEHRRDVSPALLETRDSLQRLFDSGLSRVSTFDYDCELASAIVHLHDPLESSEPPSREAMRLLVTTISNPDLPATEIDRQADLLRRDGMWQGVRSGFLARIGMSAEVAVDGFVRRTSARRRTLRALACPGCHSEVAVTDTGASCRGCQRVFPVVDGIIDFLLEPAAEPTEFSAHLFHQTLAVGSRYDQKMRTSFVRVLGRDADQAFSPEQEIDYIRAFLGSERPVLDLACGTGRLTSQMVAFVSPAELIGVDLSMSQLSACAKLGMHGTLLAHGTARELPFGDESLGAVTLINALQQMPEPQRVLAEIGRCLRPRGRLVCTTYRSHTDGIGGYIRSTYARAFKIRSFAESEIDEWCRGAGMHLLDVRGPASVLMFAAMKQEP